MRQLAGALRCGDDRLPTTRPALVKRSDQRFDAMRPQSMNILDDQQVAIAGHSLVLRAPLVGRDDADYQIRPALNGLGGEGIDEVGLAGADGAVQQQGVQSARPTPGREAGGHSLDGSPCESVFRRRYPGCTCVHTVPCHGANRRGFDHIILLEKRSFLKRISGANNKMEVIGK
jgi:hypothetical protein